jgi:lysophospholipase L1-like esterase
MKTLQQVNRATLALALTLFVSCRAISSESQEGVTMNKTPMPQSENSMRVVTFGTSLTNQNEWQKDLSLELSRYLSKDVRVYKVALGGKNSRWGLENLSRVVEFRPQIILIEFVINDSDIRHRLLLKESRDNHVAIINRLKAELPNVKIYLMTMSPALGLRRWLLRPFMPRYNAQYQEICNMLGIEFIDIAPLWHQPSVDLRAAIPDGLHPTREAVLQITVPAIAKAISKSGGSQ